VLSRTPEPLHDTAGFAVYFRHGLFTAGNDERPTIHAEGPELAENRSRRKARSSLEGISRGALPGCDDVVSRRSNLPPVLLLGAELAGRSRVHGGLAAARSFPAPPSDCWSRTGRPGLDQPGRLRDDHLRPAETFAKPFCRGRLLSVINKIRKVMATRFLLWHFPAGAQRYGSRIGPVGLVCTGAFPVAAVPASFRRRSCLEGADLARRRAHRQSLAFCARHWRSVMVTRLNTRRQCRCGSA
jgi:hypothetical protein